MTKDWCKGFCRSCGTGCAQYCEQMQDLRARITQLDELLGLVQKMCALPIVGFSKQRDILSKLRVLLRELDRR